LQSVSFFLEKYSFLILAEVDFSFQRADVLSPMLFHSIKERPTSWVGESVAWLGDFVVGGSSLQTWTLSLKETSDLPVQSGLNPFSSTLIWPIVQAHNSPGTVSPEEFHQVLMEGAKSPASGIMMFSAESIN